MWSRRVFGSTVAAIAYGAGLPARATSAPPAALAAIPLPVHEQSMRLAITEGRKNPFFPFGAVIVRATDSRVMASGVNTGAVNPTFHGEIVAINDYVARHGNAGWDKAILYTTGEPCPMCMSAMVWARIGGVVWGHVDRQVAPIRHRSDPGPGDHRDRRRAILPWRDPWRCLAGRDRRAVPKPQAPLIGLHAAAKVRCAGPAPPIPAL